MWYIKIADGDDNIERICEWCGLPYYPKHGNQKYCGDTCAKNAERDNIRDRVWKHRRKYGYQDKNTRPFGGLGPHPKLDFDEELEAIKAEKRRLGL